MTSLAIALAVCASLCSAYYPFLHFTSPRAPFRGLPEKFDLAALPNSTLSYFLSDPSGIQYGSNDSYQGLVSEIGLAAKAWNNVATSDLRITFGGVSIPGTPPSAPALEINFSELPPGLIAAGGPVTRASANGTFVPILKSVVIVQPDLTRYPSYGEAFFGTMVHEIGHALGLQHTFTSSAMATSRTRAITKARPLAADDIAGISALYPKPNFAQTTGSITGRITLDGNGVHLASVVAISPDAAAISTLTNPDGTYRIDGLPARRYFVYVHPLPPALQGQSSPGDIVLPVDNSGNSIPGGPDFETAFYPGTNTVAQAAPVDVTAGQTVEGINLAVRPSSGAILHTISTYAFPGQIAVQPPFLNQDPRMRPFIVASGYGLVSGDAPSPGLSVSILGGSTLQTRPYSPAANGFIQIDVDVRNIPLGGDSARHLLFSLNNNLYVLPSGFLMAQKMPPSITSVTSSSDGGMRTAIVTGTNLSSTTRVLFDGVDAKVQSYDEGAGRLVVLPPPAPSDYTANVTALNADGQSSLFLQDPPLTYSYSAAPIATGMPSPAPAASISASPASLPAGAEALVQIDGVNTNFTEGQVTVGLGSSDIAVRQLWVVSPTRLYANVVVSSQAKLTSANLTVLSGLQTISQPKAFTVEAMDSRTIALNSSVVNGGGQPFVTVGGVGVVTVVNGPVPANPLVFLNDTAVATSGTNGNQIQFQVPASFAAGPSVLRVEFGGQRSLPIAVQIYPPAPQIIAASVRNTFVDTARPAHPGDTVTLWIGRLADPGSVIDPARVSVNIAGMDLSPLTVAEQTGFYRVTVQLPANAPSGMQPVLLKIDNRPSEIFALAVGSA